MVVSRVYVGGLSYRVGERDLDKFFRSYGRLRDIVMKNGFAFVVSRLIRDSFILDVVVFLGVINNKKMKQKIFRLYIFLNNIVKHQ